MPRPNRPVAGLCIAAIALAAFLPGFAAFHYAVFEVRWVLLPDATPVAVAGPAIPGDEQPLSLQSLLPSRAPPARPLA